MDQDIKEPSTDDVLNAIKKSGYIMEQEVAEELQDIGFAVDTNGAYPDPEEGKSREIDVTGLKQFYINRKEKILINLFLLCECKNSKKNPFVFISRNKHQYDNEQIPEEYDFPHTNYLINNKKVPAFEALGLKRHHYYYLDKTKTVQFTKLAHYQGKEWQANTDGAFTELVTPLIKAYKYSKKEIVNSSDYDKDREVFLFFPIVIISGSMYNINSSIKPYTVEKVKHVCFVKEFQAIYTKGYHRVDFVEQTYLKNYIDEKVLPIVNAIKKIGEKDPNNIAKIRVK